MSIAFDSARIIYEDAHLIAIDKPAGLPVHAGTGHEEGAVEQLRRLLLQRGLSEFRARELAPVHRLDIETSGVLILGKHDAALRKLSEKLQSGEVEKEYLALVKGNTHKKGRIDFSLVARPTGRTKEGPGAQAGGKSLEEAITSYRRVAYVKGLSLVRAVPHTGRTHQIRRHMKGIGHPVAGDRRWGDPAFNAFLHHKGLERTFLHAARLSLKHPLSGEPLVLEAPLPTELQKVLEALGFAAEWVQELPEGAEKGEAEAGGVGPAEGGARQG